MYAIRSYYEFLNDEINNVISSIDSSDDRGSIKTLERIKKNLENRMEKLLNESRKDDILEFEQLGFDSIVVDEAHYYKNCFVPTKMTNVSGIAVTAAQKSEDMLSG